MTLCGWREGYYRSLNFDFHENKCIRKQIWGNVDVAGNDMIQ